MAVLMNSAVKTMAMVSTITAQSSGFNPTHSPMRITTVANTEWIQALCWVLKTCHQPRKACPKAAMRETMNVFSDIILLEFGFGPAQVLPGSRLALSTCGLFLPPGHDRGLVNARRRGRPEVALPLRANARLPLPAPGRAGSRSGYRPYNARPFPGPLQRRERKERL